MVRNRVDKSLGYTDELSLSTIPSVRINRRPSFGDLSLELLHVHVIPPVMYILETEHLPDLPVRQGSFVFSHLSGDLDVRVILLQDLGGGF